MVLHGAVVDRVTYFQGGNYMFYHTYGLPSSEWFNQLQHVICLILHNYYRRMCLFIFLVSA